MSMLRNALFCLLVLAASCAKTTQPDPGTNTNWLQTCDEESDCDTEDACLCGVCTKSCDEDAQCGAVHAATRCEALEESACGANADAVSACLQGCEGDDDCTALQDGRCISGVCVPENRTMSIPDGSAPDASDRDATVSVEDGGANPFALTRDDRNVVQITDLYTGCDSSNDCVIVSTACDGCCAQGTINDSLQDAYDTNFELACAGIVNGGCPCEPALMVAVCRDEACIALDSSNNCYSPSQNLDLAYLSNARGCECSMIGQSICVGGAALFCESYDSNPPETRWLSAEDGPCGEPTPDPTCAGGEVRETAAACLDDFMTCYELPSGVFCGVSP